MERAAAKSFVVSTILRPAIEATDRERNTHERQGWGGATSGMKWALSLAGLITNVTGDEVIRFIYFASTRIKAPARDIYLNLSLLAANLRLLLNVQ